MKDNREFDVIVYGASGFTGQLIAEYLAERYGVGQGLRWALAGRSEAKIREAACESDLSGEIPVITADSADQAALKDMVERTRVLG